MQNLCYFLEKNQFCQKRTLSRNPFCRNLRTFVWRKICPKIFYVEKKWQIWGLIRNTLNNLALSIRQHIIIPPRSAFDTTSRGLPEVEAPPRWTSSRKLKRNTGQKAPLFSTVSTYSREGQKTKFNHKQWNQTTQPIYLGLKRKIPQKHLQFS